MKKLPFELIKSFVRYTAIDFRYFFSPLAQPRVNTAACLQHELSGTHDNYFTGS